MDRSIIDVKNYDDVFLRKLLAGSCFFLHNNVVISQSVNGEVNDINIPVYPSNTGSQQFLMDAYMDVADYYRKTCKKVAEGNAVPVPGGIMSMKSITVARDYFTTQNVRVFAGITEDSEFGKVNNTISVRTTFIPLLVSYDVKYRVSSIIDEYKVLETVISSFSSVRKFYIGDYKGHKMLPVYIGFPDDYDYQSLLNFQAGEDTQRRDVSFVIETLSWLPKHFTGSTFKVSENVKDIIVNSTSK